jgi:hypothetical protein
MRSVRRSWIASMSVMARRLGGIILERFLR